ncbi:hypothetical protein R4Z10_10725 [Niallia sp. XMNu-256]|uniref:hypothetical protein n=1 Tax=Niallia sp. XMNu-256 TaxID=3082444 RepID=UPI0030D2F804
MPSKQLVDLVTRLKKSGVQISFTKPRSKMSLHLYNDIVPSTDKNDYSSHEKTKERTLLEYI